MLMALSDVVFALHLLFTLYHAPHLTQRMRGPNTVTVLHCCRYADTWLAWAAMERSLRQIPAARAVFKRCYNRKLEADGQLVVAMQWLRFEREEGRSVDVGGHSIVLVCHDVVRGCAGMVI